MQKKILLPLAVLAVFGMVACQQSNTSSSSSTNGSSNSSESSSSETSYPLAGEGAASLVNYQGKTYAEKAKILAALESYTMTKHLSGIPLYDSGTLEEFGKRVTLPTTKYITNYGFGLTNATLNPDGVVFNAVINEAKSEWKSYLHTSTTADAGTVNYWDSTGSDVADEYGMVQGNLFDVKMNAAKDGYSWRGALSTDARPVMLDAKGGNAVAYSEGKLSKFWRIHVKTGSAYKYHTLSSTYSAFNNTPIQLADYLTPVKAMLGVYGKKALKRGTDISGSSSGFAGAANFLGATNYDLSKDVWSTSGVGFQVNEAENSIDIEYVSAKSQFGAMYAVADSLFAPVPQSFIRALGVNSLGAGKTEAEYYAAGIGVYGTIGSSSTDSTLNCDNVLSTGAYDQESWEKNKQRSYKKNPNYVFADEINFAGSVETAYLGASASETMYQDFLLNKLDVCDIPTAYVKDRKNDPTCYKVPGSVITKMNTNSCTDEEWEYYFGENGTVYPHKSNNYWDIKAIMSNDDFLDGVYFSMDRTELANLQGRSVGLGYLSDAYMVNPEAGIGYRSSDEGKGVLRNYALGTKGDGHDDATAQACFLDAVNALIASGSIEKGTAAEPTVITLTYYFRYQDTIDNVGSYLKKYIENNFNAACKTSLGISLVVDEKVAGPSYTDCYDKMDHGEYDFGDGAIQGSALDPLNFMNTCCTNSLAQGFCLNWGERTDLVSAKDPVVYDGKRWSYDALWTVANGTGIVKDGLVTAVMAIDGEKTGLNAAKNTVDLVLDYTDVTDDAGTSVWTFAFNKFRLFIAKDSTFADGTYGGFDLSDYVGTEYTFAVDTTAKTVTLSIPTDFIYQLAGIVADAIKAKVDYFDFEFTPQYKADIPDVGVTTVPVMFDFTGTFEEFGLVPVAVPTSSAKLPVVAGNHVSSVSNTILAD